MRRRVVVAPDSFKGTISARDAALALAHGWQSERPNDELLLVPQADGGEGTLDVIAQAIPGIQWRTARVAGPTGAQHDARWLMLPDDHAMIELAECCGITLLSRDALGELALAPLTASSRGVGQAVVAALESGARRITLALGGTASTDGGLGALSALGLRLLDADSRALLDGGGALELMAAINPVLLRAAPPEGMSLLTDTTAELTGPRGAAAVFGPQKGASAEQVALLESGLALAAKIAGGDEHRWPGSGAAGGTAWGFARYWGASIQSGADTIAVLTGLDAALEGADLVITGEGRYDATSRTGKVVGAVAERASAMHAPLTIVAGQADATAMTASTGAAARTARDAAASGGESVLTLATLAGSPELAMADPKRWLRAAGANLARSVAP